MPSNLSLLKKFNPKIFCYFLFSIYQLTTLFETIVDEWTIENIRKKERKEERKKERKKERTKIFSRLMLTFTNIEQEQEQGARNC